MASNGDKIEQALEVGDGQGGLGGCSPGGCKEADTTGATELTEKRAGLDLQDQSREVSQQREQRDVCPEKARHTGRVEEGAPPLHTCHKCLSELTDAKYINNKQNNINNNEIITEIALFL